MRGSSVVRCRQHCFTSRKPAHLRDDLIHNTTGGCITWSYCLPPLPRVGVLETAGIVATPTPNVLVSAISSLPSGDGEYVSLPLLRPTACVSPRSSPIALFPALPAVPTGERMSSPLADVATCCGVTARSGLSTAIWLVVFGAVAMTLVSAPLSLPAPPHPLSIFDSIL